MRSGNAAPPASASLTVAFFSQFHGNLQIAINNRKEGTLVILESGELKSPDFEKNMISLYL
jgi:hypothetical protein